jgi:hypothetical protein
VIGKRVIPGALAVAGAIAIAACGSSGPTAVGSSLARSELRVSECMRSHGVPSFPDPKGGGFDLNGSGIDPQSPAFQAAQKRCFKLLPGGGPLAPQASEQALARARQVAQCMRRHGVSGFPDPTLKPPSLSQRSQYSIIEDDDGAVLAIPRAIDPASPGFKRAAKACGFR